MAGEDEQVERMFGYDVRSKAGDGATMQALVSSGVEIIAGELEIEGAVVPMVGLVFRIQSPDGGRGELSPVLMTPDQARAIAVQLVDSADICDKED